MDVSVEDVAGVPWQFLRNSACFSLYRARLGLDSQTVLIASTKDDNPNPENVKQLIHESSLSSELESAWAARPLTLLNMAGRTILNRRPIHIPEEAMKALERHHWPGNIRELQNVIERSVIMSGGGELQLADGALKHGRQGNEPPARRTLAECERGHILQTLTDTNWVVGGRHGAAARLGIARTTLLHKMSKLGIDRAAPAVITAPA
jgi:hypothetical protein